MTVYAFNPSSQRQTEGDFCCLKADLVYMVRVLCQLELPRGTRERGREEERGREGGKKGRREEGREGRKKRKKGQNS